MPDGYLGKDPNAKFKWWLWVGNLGKWSRDVLGAGVMKAYLRNHLPNVKYIVCTRADRSEVTLELVLHRYGDVRWRVCAS